MSDEPKKTDKKSQTLTDRRTLLGGSVEADPANPTHILTVRGLGYKFEA